MVTLLAAMIVGASGSDHSVLLPVGPKDGGYTPIITLPPPPPTPGMTRSRAKAVDSYTVTVAAGSAGDFPGNVYVVNYALDVLQWSDEKKDWVAIPKEKVDIPKDLQTPIKVTWRADSHGRVTHGHQGDIKLKGLSKSKIRFALYWIPGGDAYTPPDKEMDVVEFTVP